MVQRPRGEIYVTQIEVGLTRLRVLSGRKADADGPLTVPDPDHQELRTGTRMAINRQSGLPRSISRVGPDDTRRYRAPWVGNLLQPKGGDGDYRDPRLVSQGGPAVLSSPVATTPTRQPSGMAGDPG